MSFHYHYKVTIAYKGSHYFGWQRLSTLLEQENKPSVQGVIERALMKINHFQPAQVMAASRTDAGVHAQGQLAKILLHHPLAADKLQHRLNAQLPLHIRIMSCQPCDETFNPHKASAEKEYRYYFSTSNVISPHLIDTCCHLPHINMNQQQIEQLKQACLVFVGQHDFANFTFQGREVKNTIRTLNQFQVHQIECPMTLQHYFYFKISSSGFLKYQIRYMVGALFELMQAKSTLASITSALLQPNIKTTKKKAQAKGLHLMRITEK